VIREPELYFGRGVAVDFAANLDLVEIGCLPFHLGLSIYDLTVKLDWVVLVPPGVVTMMGPVVAPSGTVANT